MGEEQPGRSGAESAVVPEQTVPRSFTLRPYLIRPFVLRPLIPRRAVPGPAPRPGSARLRRARLGVYADPVVWAIVVVVFGAYAAISLFRLMTLTPNTFDLAMYTEYVKQYANLHATIVDIRAPGFNLLGDHFAPIVALLAPFFRVFPSAATLLVGQAFMAAVSVFPVSQVAREKLGVGPSRAIAVAYGFSWGLQQEVNFEFHEIAFAVPLLAFSLSALARGHTKAAVWWALPLVFVKEDQGYTVAAIGIYLIVAGLRARIPRTPDGADPDGSGRAIAGQILLVWGCVWSFVAITVIIPHFNPNHVYAFWNAGGALAPGQHPSVLGLTAQFLHAWPDKLPTVIWLLLPTAFIALRSPLLLIAVPGLALRFISTDTSFWGTYWHYNATAMPIFFIAAVDAMARIQAAMDVDPTAAGPTGWASGRRGLWRATQAGARRYGAAMMVAIAVPIALQFPLSQLWNAQTYRISPHIAQAEAAMAQVPDGASVLTTLDLLAPMAARTDTFWIGNGHPYTQYIVFDGVYSDFSPPITNVPAFVDSLYPPGSYTQIYVNGDVYVFRLTRS
jgi:uncharacterized membrane protein